MLEAILEEPVSYYKQGAVHSNQALTMQTGRAQSALKTLMEKWIKRKVHFWCKSKQTLEMNVNEKDECVSKINF